MSAGARLIGATIAVDVRRPRGVGRGPRHPPPRGDAGDGQHRGEHRDRGDAQHEPVGVGADVEVVVARGAEREARRERDRDADDRHRADRRERDRRGMTSAPIASGRSAPIARHVGRSAALAETARTSAWPDEHAAAEERGEREQQQSVALEVGDVQRLADAVELEGRSRRSPGGRRSRSTRRLNAGMPARPSRRSTNSLTRSGMCVPYFA